MVRGVSAAADKEKLQNFLRIEVAIFFFRCQPWDEINKKPIVMDPPLGGGGITTFLKKNPLK
jgi:hypothetical protein